MYTCLLRATTSSLTAESPTIRSLKTSLVSIQGFPPPREVHACEIHVYKVHTTGINAYEVHACEVYAYEVYAYEVHACEVYAHGMHVNEMYASEMHAYEVHAYETYACKMHVHDTHAYKIHDHKVHAMRHPPTIASVAPWPKRWSICQDLSFKIRVFVLVVGGLYCPPHPLDER
jgi:hypothetical protein